MEHPVQYRIENPVAVVTMDDGKANALSPAMRRRSGSSCCFLPTIGSFRSARAAPPPLG